MFGKVASCKTTTTLYHFFIPQLGKYSCFFLSPQGGIVHMTWKTLVFLNDSSWKWTVVACAKYRSETGKGWPAAGCSKWKLYVVRAALWSGCIASCLIGKQRSAFHGESWTVPFCSSFLCFVLNSSGQDYKCVAYSEFFVQVEKNINFWRLNFSDTCCTGCFTHRYFHCAELCDISFFVLCNSCSGRTQAQCRGAVRGVATKTQSQTHSLEGLPHL